MKTFIPFITAIATIALYFTYIEPTWNNIVSLRFEEKEFQEAVVKAEELEFIIQKLESESALITDEEMIRLDRMVPEEIDPLRLIYDMYEFGSANGVLVMDVEVGDSKSEAIIPEQGTGGSNIGALAASDADGLNKTNVSFSVTTSYGGFIDFLRKLEANLQLFDISSLSFQLAAEDKEEGGSGASQLSLSGNATYNISVDTYSAPRD